MVDIIFHAMSPSASVEDAVHTWVNRLEHAYPRIVHCEVTIAHRHRRNPFHVRVDVSVPERKFVTVCDGGDDHGHEDVFLAIAEAFIEARRQLIAHAAQQPERVAHA